MICATGSASIYFVKYSMDTIKYFICLTANGKGPRMSIPKYGEAMGCKLTSALLAAPCANRHVVGTACTAGRTLRNFALRLTNRSLHVPPWMLTISPPTWLPQIPSWSSAIILVHSSPLTHIKIGCVNPCLNNVLSTRVYLAEFLFTFLPSSGSAGRIPSAR